MGGAVGKVNDEVVAGRGGGGMHACTAVLCVKQPLASPLCCSSRCGRCGAGAGAGAGAGVVHAGTHASDSRRCICRSMCGAEQEAGADAGASPMHLSR